MMGDGTCKKFQKNWNKYLPRILALAEKSSSGKVKNVLSYYEKFSDEDQYSMLLYNLSINNYDEVGVIM